MRKRDMPARLLALLLALTLCLPLISPGLAAEDSAIATTVQLSKTEGTVAVTNGNGRKATILKNMKLYNGYHVKTEEKSYSWINLDSTKLLKEDASSKIELRKSGKKLEVLLDSGNLYFNVTKDLEEEETLNIRTSTMVAGIRGTCGWVRVIDRWNTLVYILEGQVECWVTDPVTGQIKSTILTGGEWANFVVYPQDREGDKCDILQDRFTESDISGFVLVELVQDEDLCKDIYDDSGLDVLGKYFSVEEARHRLEEDQAEAAKRQEEIKAQETRQEHNVSKDPVWKEAASNNSFSSPSSPSSPSSSGGESITPDSITLTLPVTAQEVADAIAQYKNVTVVPGPGDTPAEHTLTLDRDLTVPAGKTLTVQDTGTQTTVDPGSTLQVDGTMDIAGGFTNSGDLNVTSGNTFKVGGAFLVLAAGVISNTQSGRIVAAQGIQNAGKINNTDNAEITSGALYTILQLEDGDTPVAANPVTGITGGWITNTNPEGGFALAWEAENAAGLMPSCDHSRLRSVTPYIMGYIDRDGNHHVCLPARKSIGAPQDGYYAYQDTARELAANTKLDLNGGRITNSLTPTREGCAFQGWNTAADGSGTNYTLATWPTGDEGVPMFVYAQWGVAASYNVTVTGTVRNTENGNPIPNAMVTLSRSDGSGTPVSQHVGPDGSYTITGNLLEGDYRLVANAPMGDTLTGGSKITTFTVSKAETLTFNLTLALYRYTVTITGKVTDQRGNAITGATVSLGENSAVSGNDGSYTLTARSMPAGSYTLTAELVADDLTKNYEIGDMDDPIPSPSSGRVTYADSGTAAIMDRTPITQNFVFTVPNDAYIETITGKVTHSGGQPVPGVSVILETPARPDYSRLSNTDTQGVYTMPSVLVKAATAISLEVSDSTYGSAMVSFQIPRGMVNHPTGVTTQDLRLSPATDTVTLQIQGQVASGKDEGGNPIPVPNVEITVSSGSDVAPVTAISGADGKFSCSITLTKGQAITVSVSGVEGVEPPEEQIFDTTIYESGDVITADFELTYLAAEMIEVTVSGKVTEAATMDPVSGATVTVTAFGGSFSQTTGDDGLYSIEKIPSAVGDTITVGVQAYGYEVPNSWMATIGQADSPSTSGINFELTPSSVMRSVAFSGKVTDEQGQGVPDADVALYLPETSRAADDTQGFSVSGTVKTGTDGAYSFTKAVPDGTYVIKATAGGRTVSSSKITVTADTAATITVPNIKVGIDYTIENGVMTVVGCGRMALYGSPDQSPWYSQRNTITNVVIGDHITHVANYGFRNFPNLVSVTFPEREGGLSVGEYAFANCDKLNQITIPKNIGIGIYAFSGCDNLTEIVFPESGDVKLGNYAFERCSNLAKITNFDSVTSIGNYAFYGCTSLSGIDIPKDVTSIAPSTFSGCTALQRVTIPKSITSIGSSAFLNCSNLQSVTIEAGVTSIGTSAFQGCKALSNITIPNTVAEIGNAAFHQCTNLTDLTIPDSVTSIGQNMCYGCNRLKNVTLPGNITEIPYRAFMETSLANITIPESVTAIGSEAFRGCPLVNVAIPENVVTIGSQAFDQHQNPTGDYKKTLTSVTFSENAKLETIGDAAFQRCNQLTEVTIPASVTTINWRAFWDCNTIKKLIFARGSNLQTIGTYAFEHCRGLTSIVLPEGLRLIDQNAFSSCTGLTEVTIPHSVTTLGSNAFNGCTKLKTVHYQGTRAEWETLGTGLGLSSDAVVHCIDDEATPSNPDTPTSIASLRYGRLAGAAIRPVLRETLSASAAAAGGFADVSAGSWYADAADYCRAAGLMTGTGEELFHPEGLMTRAMAASVLYRLAGSPPLETEETAFSDVSAGAWYTDAVLWAQGSGAMGGYPDGRFDPDGTITREQLVAVLWRFGGCPAGEGRAFADSAVIAPYAVQAVGWASGAGIISGIPGGRFDPRGAVTRAQTAQILMNYVRVQGLATAVSAMNVMCEPAGMVLAEDGSLLVTDTYNKLIWRVADGVSSIYAGSGTVEDLYGEPLGGYNDAALEKSYFKRPWAITPFLDGWAVSDTDNRAVRLISGEITQTVNGQTSERLTVSDLGVVFDAPTGLASDGEGNLYVSDTAQDAIRKITPEGEVTTFAKGLNGPMGLFWADGVLYAAETGAHRIVKITDRKVTAIAGSGQSGFEDGPADQAAFSAPQAVAVDEDGTVYVADTANSAIRQIRDGQVTTLLCRDVTKLDSFAPISPTGLLVRENILYICDNFSRKLLVFPLK